jgi:hypothetical protein
MASEMYELPEMVAVRVPNGYQCGPYRAAKCGDKFNVFLDVWEFAVRPATAEALQSACIDHIHKRTASLGLVRLVRVKEKPDVG